MVTYSFQPQFILPIVAGRKRQTIRAICSKRHVREREAIQLYTAMRTKACRKIGDAVCAFVVPVRLLLDQDRVVVSGVETWPAALDGFAQRDGFADWADMKAFWAEHHPGVTDFEGLLIAWRDFVTSAQVA